MRVSIIKKIGPYDGPHEKNIITYKMRTEEGHEIAWHENGKRGLVARVGQTFTGLVMRGKQPDYKKSKLVDTQLKIEI